MQINYEYDNVSASERLEELTSKKIDVLIKKYDFIIRADVFFRSEKTSDKNTGKICNIRLSVPGPRLFAEASHEKFEMSIAEATSDLDKQLRKKKDKLKAKQHFQY